MVTIEELKDLIAQFESSTLKELHFEEKDVVVSFSKNDHPVFVKEGHHEEKQKEVTQKGASVSNDDKSLEKENYTQVKAPLIGTFYRQPSPEEENFVEVGQVISKGQIIGIIEAMKVMNEIPSPVSGVVKKIHAQNQGIVEFDDVLIEVEE